MTTLNRQRIKENAIRYDYNEILEKGYTKLATDNFAKKRAKEIESMFGIEVKVDDNKITLF